MKYLVYQVGCIECGVSSYPIAVCDSLEQAVHIKECHPSTWETEGGEGFVDIINLEKCKAYNEIKEQKNKKDEKSI